MKILSPCLSLLLLSSCLPACTGSSEPMVGVQPEAGSDAPIDGDPADAPSSSDADTDGDKPDGGVEDASGDVLADIGKEDGDLVDSDVPDSLGDSQDDVEDATIDTEPDGSGGCNTLAAVRALAPEQPGSPVSVDCTLPSVFVTYLGNTEYFVQDSVAGPGLLVDEGSGWIPDVAVGDEIEMTVTEVGNWRGNQQITSHDPVGTPLSTGNDLSAWVVNLSATSSEPSEDIEHQRVHVIGATVTAIDGNELTISYGTTEDVLLVTSGYTHGDLCVGASFDVLGVITQFDARHQITSWSETDITSVDTTGCSPPLSAGDLVINEVDYDNPGIDIAEFVEIFNRTGGALDLSNVILVFYNGSNGEAYRTVNLHGTLESYGFYVVCNDDGAGAPSVSLPVGTPYTLMGTSNQIQNGSPDGMALIDVNGGIVLDVLSYEGEMTPVTHPSISGSFSLVTGSAATVADNNTYDASLARFPDGQDTGDASSDWFETTTLTPGAANFITSP